MSFASFPLDTLGLKQQYVNACARAGLATASDVLLCAPADLAKKLRNSNMPVQIPDLVQAVSLAIAPQVHSVASLLSRPDHGREAEAKSSVATFISTGDATLDVMLGGGVRVGTLTEITGESAAGKSHLTLALAIAAQLPPPLPVLVEEDDETGPPPTLPTVGGGTIILTSERILATSRLVELAEGMSARVDDPPPIAEILDNVHTSRVVDIDALEHALAFAVPPMLAARRPETNSPLLGQQVVHEPSTSRGESPPRRPRRGEKPICLIIIDSITALLRGETESSSSSLTQRSRYLCTIGDRLKALAVQYELAVVVVNQVKDVFAPGFGVGVPITSALPGVSTLNGADGVTSLTGDVAPPPSQASSVDTALPPMLYATQARHFSGQSAGVAKEAALGIVWANTVNTRLMLARTGRRRVVTDDDLRGLKRARTVHAAGHPPPDGQSNGEVGEDKELIRRFQLVFSPFAPPAMLDYIILPDGIRALPASLRLVDLGPAIRRRDLRLRAALDDGRASPGPTRDDDDDPGAHLGSDIYDEMDIPPELWEGLDDEVEPPGSPMAVGVVD